MTTLDLYEKYQKIAEERKQFWAVSREDFYDALGGPCYFCGTVDKSDEGAIVKLDKALGYVKANIRPICKRCPDTASVDVERYCDIILHHNLDQLSPAQIRHILSKTRREFASSRWDEELTVNGQQVHLEALDREKRGKRD